MSPSATDGVQNSGSLRDAIAARLNSGGSEQTPALQPDEPHAAAPLTAEQNNPGDPAPVEPAVDGANDLQLETPAVDDFSLDLDKDPLAESAAPVEQPPADEIQLSRSQWDKEFTATLEKHPRGRAFLESHRELSKVAAPPEDGGIGFRPDAEQIREWYSAQSQMDQMRADFIHGTPESRSNWVYNWFGKDDQGRTFPGADQVIEALPETLSKVNPEAYSKIGSHYRAELLTHIATLAERGNYSPEDKERLNDAALLLSTITGIPINGTASPKAAPESPNAEVQRLQQRVRELETVHQRKAQEGIHAKVMGYLDDTVARDVDQALAPLKDAFKNSPLIFEATRNQAIAEVKQVARSNRSVGAEIEKALSVMVRSGTTNGVDRVQKLFRGAYSDPLKVIRSKYLQAAGVALVGKNDEQRAILQQSANKTAPANGAAPAQSQTFSARQQGESVDDFRRRSIRERMTSRVG